MRRFYLLWVLLDTSATTVRRRTLFGCVPTLRLSIALGVVVHLSWMGRQVNWC